MGCQLTDSEVGDVRGRGGGGGKEFIRLSKSFICDQVILIVTQPNSFDLPRD